MREGLDVDCGAWNGDGGESGVAGLGEGLRSVLGDLDCDLEESRFLLDFELTAKVGAKFRSPLRLSSKSSSTSTKFVKKSKHS